MKPLSLVLSTKREDWRMNDSSSGAADAEFSKVRAKARQRDEYTCRFCGFKHAKPDKIGGREMHYYMQVHHLNDDHHDNREENLVTACMHCHAVQHIGLYGANEEARIVWLPEWSQAYLNHFSRVKLMAQRYVLKAEMEFASTAGRGMPRAQPATSSMEKLKAAKTASDAINAVWDRVLAREAEAQERLLTSDPSQLGTAMLALPDDVYENRHLMFGQFRLVLLGHHHMGGKANSAIDSMAEIVDGWLIPGGPFSGLEPTIWQKLLSKGNR